MGIFQDLQERGLIHQSTDEVGLVKVLSQERIPLYCGFDPSSDSLHVGNLMGILALRRMQLAGHQPIALVGGATGMIGDPSGKSNERSLLNAEKVTENLRGIQKVIERFLDFTGTNKALLVNNADWFQKFSYLGFLRDVGKHFTVNHMLAKESVRSRLEDRDQGISYTEFSYMLLQAYDFYVLNKEQGCRLQVGGSDQWGNITAGTELIRRIRAAHSELGSDVFGLTFPLITKSDGTKFGKSESGALWLSTEKTSPYQLYQYFLQTPDADVIRFLSYFTFRSLNERTEIERMVETQPEKREAQKILAGDLVELIHGKEERSKSEQASLALFQGGSVRDLNPNTLEQVFSEAPSIEKSLSLFQSGISLLDLLVESQLCASKGAARKDLQGGGIYVNDERCSDVNQIIKTDSLLGGRYLVLRKGKKTYHLVKVKN